MTYKLRTSQERILAYEEGKMGVSAVPGSGKTWTLSLLAAEIIQKGRINDDQEVLVVTLVNSAVDNFYHRVGEFINTFNLIPNIGYRVRTLHGLAHDIVRERPGLVNLDEDFRIIDEQEARSIRSEIGRSWLRSHPDFFEDYLDYFLDEDRLAWIRKTQLYTLLDDIMLGFIRKAKDSQVSPEKLSERLAASPLRLPLGEMGLELYQEYQRALRYRGGVDFDDLINMALSAIQSNPDYLERLRYRWPYILEDEAQDSSQLQERILSELTGVDGNWVRVGDPNQAIFETFTTADPKYLREFIEREDVLSRELDESGRSTESIIRVANYLVDWSARAHPNEAVRDALQAPPFIEPTGPGDPQSNPEDRPLNVHIIIDEYTSDEEINQVVRSIEHWLPANPKSTIAVLVPRNERGADLVNHLKQRGIEFVDSLLRSSIATRTTTGALTLCLEYLADPKSARKLAKVYEVYQRKDREDNNKWEVVKQLSEQVRKIRKLERFLSPLLDELWEDEFAGFELTESVRESLDSFRELIVRWHEAVILPVDQLVLTLAQDLRFDGSELALCHKLAGLLRDASLIDPAWRLAEFTQELKEIALNERRFIGFSEDDRGFDPGKYRGKVVVSTIHKAKGLEWDRVYLMSVNNYNFPSGSDNDTYIAEKWFLNRKINLQAEAIAQFQHAFEVSEFDAYNEGDATLAARQDYIRERLRLLYVGITRAKKDLIITWNTGRRRESVPALPLVALYDFWETQKQDGEE